MTQYQNSTLHNSHDMMQKLFEEINNYLGDQGEATTNSSPPAPPPDLSPFNLSTEGEEDNDFVEKTQYHDAKTIDHLSHETHLQPAMFVESKAGDGGRNQNDSNHFQHDHADETTNFNECSRYMTQLDNNSYEDVHTANNANQSPGPPSSTTKRPFLRRPKSSTSFGAVGNAKLSRFSGLVKQTFTTSATTSTKTPPSPSTTTKHQQERRHSFLSSTTRFDKRHSISPTSQTIHDHHTETPPSPLPAAQSYSYDNLVEGDSGELYNGTQMNLEYRPNSHGVLYDDGHQGNNSGFGMSTTTTKTTPATSPGLNDLDTSSNFNHSELHQVDSYGALLSYDDSCAGEQQQVLNGSLANQLPFLTPIHRIGEPHTVTLRTHMARDVGTHEDRINAYNNAYSHCIMARSDMVPWIKKQYSKGPPDLTTHLDYTPRHRKSSNCLLGLFKRQSKSTLPPSSTPSKLAVTGHSDSSKLATSSTRSSISMEPSTTAYHQVQQLQYGTEYQQGMTSSPATPSISEEETYPSTNWTATGEPENDDNGLQQQQKAQDNHCPLNGKKKSKSLALTEEVPVPVLKESFSASTSPMTSDHTVPLSTKFSSSAVDFGLKNISSLSSFIEDQSPSPLEYQQFNGASRSPLTPVSRTSKTNSKKGSHFPMRASSEDWSLSSPHQQQSQSKSPSHHRSRSTSPMAPPPPLSPLTIQQYPSPFTDPPDIIHHHRRQHSGGYRRNSPSLIPPSSSRHHPSNQQSWQHLTNDSYCNINHGLLPTPSAGIHGSRRRISRTKSNEYISMSPPRDGPKKMNHHRRSSSSQLVTPAHDTYVQPWRTHQSRRLSKASSHSNLRSDYYLSGNGVPLLYATADNKRYRRRWSMAADDDSVYYLPVRTPTHPPPPPPVRLSKQQQKHRYNQALDELCHLFQHLPRHVLFKYLQDAQGDFYLAKDMCMEDILANGI